jgi:hypothetical protein
MHACIHRNRQGDQIGRIIPCWAIFYYGQLFVNYERGPNFFTTLFQSKSNTSWQKWAGQNFGLFYSKTRCYVFFPNVKLQNAKFPTVTLPNFKSSNGQMFEWAKVRHVIISNRQMFELPIFECTKFSKKNHVIYKSRQFVTSYFIAIGPD